LALLIKKSKAITVAWPLFAIGASFIVLFLLSPKVLFTSYGADGRFILPAALLFVASIKIEAPARAATILMIAYLVLAGIRVGSIWRSWSILDHQIAAEVDRLKMLPEGAAVYPLFRADEDLEQNKQQRSFEHALHYATISRRVFVPSLFALPGQQPLVFRTSPGFSGSPEVNNLQWLIELPKYDYVWTYALRPEARDSLISRSTLVSQTNGFELWKVDSRQHPNRVQAELRTKR
jgi:hypothetical protein